MPTAQEQHVLIIGAGVTGLLIAHGLQKAGVKHTIFESEDPARFRPKEWTMGIHWGLPLLEQLLPHDLAARISTDASVDGSLDYRKPPNNGAYIYDGVTGEILKDLTPANDCIVRVSRRKLRALCREHVDVKYNHTLEDVQWNNDQKTVTVTFNNGTEATGTLLVGADGPRSTVRNAIFPHDLNAVQAQPIEGVVTISMAFCYPDAETARKVRGAHPVWCMCIHPDIFPFLSMQEVPDPDRPETWRFYMVLSWLGEKDDSLDNAGRLKAIKERGEKLAEVSRAVLSLLFSYYFSRHSTHDADEDTCSHSVQLSCPSRMIQTPRMSNSSTGLHNRGTHATAA